MDESQSATTPPRRKLSRGMRVLVIFVALFVVLQLGEVVWRALRPERPQTPQVRTAAEAADEPIRPVVRLDGSLVVVEFGRDRTRVTLDEGEDPEALMTCVRADLERLFGPLDADGPLPESAASLSRRDLRQRVRDVTQGCIRGIAPGPGPG